MKKPRKDSKGNRMLKTAKKHKLGLEYGQKLAAAMRKICAEKRACPDAD